MPRAIVSGDPGATWTNDTGKVRYQLIVDWHFSCALCCQFDHQVGPSWPIPFHRSCRCKQISVWPGQESRPFVDYREKIRDLDRAQQAAVMGRANLVLVEKGVVSWADVVSGQRVRDLREVVATRRLTVERMTRAGVQPATARQAYASVHTPAHELARSKREELLRKIAEKGLTRDQIRRALGERLAGRVTPGDLPGGAQPAGTRPAAPPPPGSPAAAAPTRAPRPAPAP